MTAKRKYYPGDVKAQRIRKRQRIREFICAYLREHPCVDCGEDDIVVLEFDHVRGEKIANVSYLVNHLKPTATVRREIDKCEVVCANCHARRSAKRGGFYRCSL